MAPKRQSRLPSPACKSTPLQPASQHISHSLSNRDRGQVCVGSRHLLHHRSIENQKPRGANYPAAYVHHRFRIRRITHSAGPACMLRIGAFGHQPVAQRRIVQLLRDRAPRRAVLGPLGDGLERCPRHSSRGACRSVRLAISCGQRKPSSPIARMGSGTLMCSGVSADACPVPPSATARASPDPRLAAPPEPNMPIHPQLSRSRIRLNSPQPPLTLAVRRICKHHAFSPPHLIPPTAGRPHAGTDAPAQAAQGRSPAPAGNRHRGCGQAVPAFPRPQLRPPC